MAYARERAASYLLPDPGGEVVRSMIDRINELEDQVRGADAAICAPNLSDSERLTLAHTILTNP